MLLLPVLLFCAVLVKIAFCAEAPRIKEDNESGKKMSICNVTVLPAPNTIEIKGSAMGTFSDRNNSAGSNKKDLLPAKYSTPEKEEKVKFKDNDGSESLPSMSVKRNPERFYDVDGRYFFPDGTQQDSSWNAQVESPVTIGIE